LTITIPTNSTAVDCFAKSLLILQQLKLVRLHTKMTDLNDDEIEQMRDAGFTDLEIAFFNDLNKKREETRGRFTRMGYQISCDAVSRMHRIVSQENRHFSSRCGMEYPTFMEHVVRACEQKEKELSALGDRLHSRGKQAPMDHRIFRTLCFFRNETSYSISGMCGQSPSTVYKDCGVVTSLIAGLSKKWIRMVRHTSAEYQCLRGGGDFRCIPNVVYSADGTIIIIPKPRKDQAMYYNAGKKKHCYKYATFCDGFGKTVFISGKIRGRQAERDFFNGNGFYDKIGRYAVVNILCI